MSLGRFIQERRLELALSRGEVAAACFVPEERIRRLEVEPNAPIPRPSLANRLASVLQVTVSTLLIFAGYNIRPDERDRALVARMMGEEYRWDA